MKIAFVRHGERTSRRDDSPLTVRGRAMVTQTGAWLAEHLAHPELLIHTGRPRTVETAALLLVAMKRQCPQRNRGALPRDQRGWGALLEELRRDEPAEVILVGHHPTQQLIERVLGGRAFSVPRHHRAAAFVLQECDGVWRCVAAWPGSQAH